MFEIKLKNNKIFTCDKDSTIFEAAKKSNIVLEHSCLSSRCRSCVVKVLSGKTINKEKELVLSEEDKNANFVLSCNAKPLSDLELDIEDLGEITLFEKKITPSKISVIEKLTDDVIKVVLRLPPNSNFNFNSGQYVNIIKGHITRSYSIANCSNHKNQLEFLIKNYENGLMSEYFFKEAKINDLLRLEGPIGTFFLRDSSFKNIIFLATGTGIAPIKSILEGLDKSHEQYQNKNFWVFIGARHQEDLFWNPNFKNLNIKYIPVLSRPENDWKGSKGYVQDIVLKQQIDIENTQVYACGSNNMIKSAKELFFKNNLKENNFFSDAFVQTNTQTMKAVILAGGLGTRLSEETVYKPKPMVEIGGKPILWHIMKTYSYYGIKDFIICCGYKGYVIKEYFANYFLHQSDVTFDMKNNKMTVHKDRAEPWTVTLVDTGDNSMTGGRLKRVLPYLKNEEAFCFTYGDGVADINIRSLIKFHKSHGKLATLTATFPPGRFGALVINNDSVEKFEEKPKGDGALINGGYFVLSPKVIERIADDTTTWEQEPLKGLAKDNQLMAFKHDGFWQPMDTIRDKWKLSELIEQNKAPWEVWK